MLTLNCSIGYQNIEGLHSSLLGCKLENQIDFNCDIEIISETWSSCEKCKKSSVPGYVFLKQTEPEKKGKKRAEVLEAYRSTTDHF